MTRTLVVDRSFRGVGRICRRSGTANPVVLKKYHRMLDNFRDDGRLDLLRAIRDGVLTIPEAYDAYRRGALHELATADTAKPLRKAWAKWLVSLEVPADLSDKHRYTHTMSGRYLQRAGANTRVVDLPRLLRKLRDSLGKKHPRSFKATKDSALAFVRDTLTTGHQLYRDVAAVPVRPVRVRRHGQHLAPEQMRGFFPKPESDPVDAIAWSMATTGMGQSELWGEWAVYSDRIHIVGTKRPGRVRDIPLARRPTVPTMHRRTFENRLRERTSAVQPYDLRRTYAHWLEEAGISRSRRMVYMGHSTKNVTDIYERHEVRRFLSKDAAKLREYLGLGPVQIAGLTVIRAGQQR